MDQKRRAEMFFAFLNSVINVSIFCIGSRKCKRNMVKFY